MRQTLIALDQLINALFFKEWADETISARAYRRSAQGKQKWHWFMRAIDALFFLEKNHCKESYEMEQMRMHMPPAYRSVYKTIMTTQFSDKADIK